ncbi:MAG: cyanophycinase [Candidatus Aminicenantia bacterium]
MRRFILYVFLLSLFLFNLFADGHLIIMGGGPRPEEVMKKFVELSGPGKIVVFPTASSEPEVTGENLKKEFEKAGAREVIVLNIRKREDAENPEFFEKAKDANGFFFSGGDQRRITEAFLETPFHQFLKRKFKDGAVIGGTSAGTAAMSELMITGEGDFTVIEKGSVELAKGLGLFKYGILDQHFLKRQRNNRLISAVLQNPHFIGVGIDEGTAIWVKPGWKFEVMGNSQVTIYEVKKEKIFAKNISGKQKLGTLQLVERIIYKGYGYDLRKRKVLKYE